MPAHFNDNVFLWLVEFNNVGPAVVMPTCAIHDVITCSLQLLEEAGGLHGVLERLDVKELYVHLGPLVLQSKAMSTEAWAATLSVGVGMASLEANRTSDNKGSIVGLLRDYPSIFCTLTMHVSEENNVVLLHLKAIHLELNGND